MDNNEKLGREREEKLRDATRDRAKYDDGGNRITKREWITDDNGNETYIEKNIHGDVVKEEKSDKDKKENKEVEGKKRGKGKQSNLADIKGLKKNISNINSKYKANKNDKKLKKVAKGTIRTLSMIKIIIIFLVTHVWFTLTIGIFTMFLMFGVLAAIGETTGEYSEEYVATGTSSGRTGTGEVPYIGGKYKVYMPIKESTTITSKYGWRTVEGWVNFHNGVDFSVGRYSPGTSVYSALPGKVVKVVRSSNPPKTILDGGNVNLRGEASKGQYIVIEHEVEDFKLYTIYMHLYRIQVDVGDSVGNNDVIGVAGNTGTSTGPHLHFEIRLKSQKGQTLNPEQYIYR